MNLYGIGFTANGSKALGEGIAKCASLTFLNIHLCGNHIGLNGRKIIEDCLVTQKH